MTIKFNVGGAAVVIPGVYSVYSVEDSLLNVSAPSRNILVLGESDQGIPGSELNLSVAYFTNYVDLQAAYVSGPIVDAGRQLFTVQPSAVFTNSIGRLYVHQTNEATRAETEIASPVGFGSLVATKFGENGNFTKAQIKSTTSVLPTETFSLIPSASSLPVSVGINGSQVATSTFLASGNYPTNLSALNSMLSSDGSATGGAYQPTVPATGNLTLTALDDTLTVVSDTPWLSIPAVDSVVMIPHTSDVVGATQENAGVYLVESATNLSIVLKKIRSWNATGTADIAYVAPASVASTAIAGAQNAYATAELLVLAPATIAVSAAPVSGAGSSLELSSGSLSLAGVFVKLSQKQNIISQAQANIGSISATATGTDLSVSLSGGAFWSMVPKAGDVIMVAWDSPLAISTSANAGLYVVNSSSPTTLSLSKTDGVATVAVPAVALAGNIEAVKWMPGFVSTSAKPMATTSATESQVWVEAANTLTGELFPTTRVGGQVALKIGYWSATATGASLSIDQNRRLTITVTASPAVAPINVPLLKYPNLSALVEFLNTLPGVSAELGSLALASARTNTLDMVQGMEILALEEGAMPGRIKNDYSSWTNFFAETASIVDFKEGAILYKAGLPAASSLSFLTGGAKGGTSNASVQAGLDAGLKVATSQVIPLFSRDAYLDVADGLTDESSTYTIESINAALRAHVSTAWGTKVRKERFGLASYYGTFENSKTAAQTLGYEYVSMAFQLVRTTGANGEAQWFQPWMLQCMLAAGRAQSVLGTSMLRKAFNMLDVKHTGQELSIYTESLARDFEDDNYGELEEAIEAGLLTFGTVEGQGLRLVSPDLSTRSRINDPKAWVYERTNVMFTMAEVMQTERITVENYIGERTSDVSGADIASVVEDVLRSFVTNGALIAYDRNILVTSQGNGYSVKYRCKPAEALEFVSLEQIFTREI